MSVFDSPAFDGHERVLARYDEASGLKAVIAVHSTARGPAAGGCRMWNYASSAAALDDALKLSRAMSYKNAMADLELGGGKAVIIGDARRQKTPALFEALGEAVESLGGRYWTTEDVGVSPQDLAHTRKTTRYVAGLVGHRAASGDPSPVTADGVFRAVRLAVRRRLDKDLDQVAVAIQGAGHVGGGLADRLAAAGARVIVADINAELAAAVAGRTGGQAVKAEAIFDVACDVFAPCALGGAINADTVPRLKAKIVVGGANNQLSASEVGDYLFDKGVLYAPDYVVNGGGIINVAAEIRALDRDEAYDPAWVEGKVSRMIQTLEEVLDRSMAERRPPHQVADQIARSRIEAARPAS